MKRAGMEIQIYNRNVQKPTKPRQCAENILHTDCNPNSTKACLLNCFLKSQFKN